MLREFLADIRTQKLRTTLTVLGIAWGTVAVVVLLAFGVGLERQTKKRFHGLGDRIVILFGGRTTRPWAGFPDGRRIPLHAEDAEMLLQQVPEITKLSPEYIDQSTRVHRGLKAATPTITGVTPVYGDIRNIIAQAGGRFLDDRDVAERRRVAVLGDVLAQLLFDSADAVGKQIMVGDTPFLVIGVMQPKLQNSSYQSRDKDRVFIPASTHFALFGKRELNDIVYRAASPELTKVAERHVYETMGRKYKFDPDDKDALGVWDTSEWETRFGYLFLAFNIFFAVVGSFTLLVGGIGVANIMYIVVRERAREIGIRRAVGATRRDILRQFFAETLLIVLLGAVAGMVLSVGIVFGLGSMPIRDFVGAPVISGTVLLATLALLALVAFAAGLLPARQAAALDPVEALRS
ncbi:MAG TPA: ABC transporter permease [Gemmatimonadales bacterium]|nr:ABC transporter permease [Gemmatimonadales bacterium]